MEGSSSRNDSPFSRRRVVVLPARPRPTKYRRTTGSGATLFFWCSKESFCKRSSSSFCRERKQIHAFEQHCMESSYNTINEGSLCDRRTIEFMRHPAMSTTQNSYHYDLLFWDLPIGYSSLLVQDLTNKGLACAKGSNLRAGILARMLLSPVHMH